MSVWPSFRGITDAPTRAAGGWSAGLGRSARRADRALGPWPGGRVTSWPTPDWPAVVAKLLSRAGRGWSTDRGPTATRHRRAVPLADLSTVMADADLVVAATGAREQKRPPMLLTRGAGDGRPLVVDTPRPATPIWEVAAFGGSKPTWTRSPPSPRPGNRSSPEVASQRRSSTKGRAVPRRQSNAGVPRRSSPPARAGASAAPRSTGLSGRLGELTDAQRDAVDAIT